MNHSHHTVLRQGEALAPLAFESEAAREMFECCVQDAIENDQQKSHSSLGVPFIIGLSRSKETSRTAIRNDVATKFDINSDRLISEYEVSLHHR